MASTATTQTPGAIEPGVLYTLDEIKRRSKLGEWALRTARRNGLRVIYTGGRGCGTPAFRPRWRSTPPRIAAWPMRSEILVTKLVPNETSLPPPNRENLKNPDEK
jgi:hypothetical protein